MGTGHADSVNIKNAHSVVLSQPHALRAEGGEVDQLPTRFKILDWGKNIGRTTGAEINVTAKTVEVLKANQEANAHETVPLDYEHQSVVGHPAYKEHPHHYAAHGEIEVIEGDGIYYSAAEYTPNGKEFAASYKDVSAVAYTDDQGDVIFIQSVALTQNGDVDGMEFQTALSAHLTNQSQTKNNMDKDTNKHKDMLIALLGLKPADGADDVTDEAIAAAIAAHDEKSKASDKPAEEAKDKDQMVALNARLDGIEKNRVVDNAVAQGKLIPLSAEQITDMDINVLSSIIDKLKPGQVNVDKTAQTEKPSDKVALSADEKALCERLNISEEDFKSVNG